jgi:hypothetical protein
MIINILVISLPSLCLGLGFVSYDFARTVSPRSIVPTFRIFQIVAELPDTPDCGIPEQVAAEFPHPHHFDNRIHRHDVATDWRAHFQIIYGSVRNAQFIIATHCPPQGMKFIAPVEKFKS